MEIDALITQLPEEMHNDLRSVRHHVDLRQRFLVDNEQRTQAEQMINYNLKNVFQKCGHVWDSKHMDLVYPFENFLVMVHEFVNGNSLDAAAKRLRASNNFTAAVVGTPRI